jgi:hypothetical protein
MYCVFHTVNSQAGSKSCNVMRLSLELLLIREYAVLIPEYAYHWYNSLSVINSKRLNKINHSLDDQRAVDSFFKVLLSFSPV